MYIPDQVRSMTENTGYKAIVVLVSTCGDMTEYNRDDELVPDIGKIAEEEYGKLTKKKGADLARFMAETLVPYVQKNYNVYTDALHTSVTGASLGGLETFYITMEYPEVFGTAGAQSPSFWTYSDDTWKKYLSEKDFGKNTPFIYLYTGPSGGDTDPYVTEMYNRMIDMGYPADKVSPISMISMAITSTTGAAIFRNFYRRWYFRASNRCKRKMNNIQIDKAAGSIASLPLFSILSNQYA